MHLALASSSPYRRALLNRLGIEFQCCDPAIDERPLPEETAAALARRLAEAKARSVAPRFPSHLIIGSDQTATDGDGLIDKPGSTAGARAQLLRLAGRPVTFFTGLCVFDAATGVCTTDVVATATRYRTLSAADVDRYLAREPAVDCTGSVRVEGLGILLFDALSSTDPTALIGLPLIRLRQLLADFGFDLLQPTTPGRSGS